MKSAVKYKAIIVLVGFVAVAVSSLVTAGAASFCDPEPLFSVYGQDHRDLSTKKSQLSLSVLPYYQYACNAKDGHHDKVPLGDRLGMINVLGLLINDDPSPYENKFGEDADDSTLHAAYNALNTGITDANRVFLGATYGPLEPSDSRVNWGKYQTTTRFERIGVRGAVHYSFYNGVAVSLRGGVAEYSIKQPSYLANPKYDVNSGVWYNAALAGGADAFLADKIQPYLMAQARQKEIGEELGIDFGAVKDTGVEDVFVEVSWRKGFKMNDSEGDHVLTMTPLIAVTAALPTAEKKVVGRLFDISLGNDGFYGFTPQAEVSFDFPGMLKVGVGATGTFFIEDSIGKQFVPTSEYQEGIYPWQATVTKRPGALWKAYATVRAINFLDYLSCFLTYMYVSHAKDTITVTGANKASFLGDKLGRDGRYTAQMVHVGFEYEITPALRFGAAMQSVFAGMQIWKTTTFAASLTMTF